MTTKRESILAAIAAALAGTTGVSTRIYRSRVEAIPRDESPAILIEPLQDVPSDLSMSGTPLQWILTIRITVVARGDIPDQAADPTVLSLHSKMMADVTLGGLAQDIQPGNVLFSLEGADSAAGTTACEYNIAYRTQYANLGS